LSASQIASTQTLLACATFFGGAAIRICDSLLPRLAADFRVTAGVAGRVIIGYAIAYGLMQLLFGPLGDRYGKARMVCVALFMCAAMSFASVFAANFDVLVATRALWGIGAAGIVPLAMAWVGDVVPYEQRQATLARLLLGTLSGMMAGQLGGGLFADSALGWRGAFAAMTAGYVIVGTLLALHIRKLPAAPPSHHARQPFHAQLLSVLSIPWSRAVLLAVALEGAFLLGPLAFLPSYLHTRFGVSLTIASAAIALYAVGGLVYAVTAKQLVARLGERRMVAWGGVLAGLCFIGFWAQPAWAFAGPVALALGFGTYLYHNTLQTHATQMAPQQRGTAVALFASCLFGGQALGVSMSGWAYDRFGAGPLLAVAAAVMPLAGWWFARALKRRAA
jgi:predicted MFS family arabinose efflux permease